MPEKRYVVRADGAHKNWWRSLWEAKVAARRLFESDKTKVVTVHLVDDSAVEREKETVCVLYVS